MNYFSVYGGIWVQVVYLVFHFLECEETREQNAQIDSFRDMGALKTNHYVGKANISYGQKVIAREVPPNI